jgi:hypothetical protein
MTWFSVSYTGSPSQSFAISEGIFPKARLISGAVAGEGGQGGPWPLLLFETRRKIVNVVGNCRKIVNVVGNCQSCRGGGEDLKCCRPEKFFGLSEKIFGLSEMHCPCPPQKKHGSHGATAPNQCRVFFSLPLLFLYHFTLQFDYIYYLY